MGPDFTPKRQTPFSAEELNPEQPRTRRFSIEQIEMFVIERLREAEEYIQNCDYSTAEKGVKAALGFLEEQSYPKDSSLFVAVYSLLYVVAQALGEPQQAADHISRAIQTQTSVRGDQEGREKLAELLLVKADHCNSQGKYAEADALWQKIFGNFHEVSVRVAALLGAARTARASGREEEHDRWMHNALEQLAWTDELDEKYKTAHVLFLASDMEPVQDAATLLERTLKLIEDVEKRSSFEQDKTMTYEFINIPSFKEEVSMELAAYYEKLGKYEMSYQLRSRTLRAAEKSVGSRDSHVLSLRSRVASGLLEQGRFEHAEALLEDNLTYARESGELEDLAEATFGLAYAHHQQGHYRDALNVLAELEQKLERVSCDPAIMVALLRMKAGVYSTCGKRDNALENLEAALEQASKIPGVAGDVERVQILATIADVAGDTNRDLARSKISAAKDILDTLPPHQRNITYLGLSMIESRLGNDDGDPSRMVEMIREALELEDQRSRGSNTSQKVELLIEQSDLYRKAGNNADAMAALDSARTILENCGRTTSVEYGVVLYRLSEIVDLDCAEEYQRKADMILRKMQRLKDDTSTQDDT